MKPPAPSWPPRFFPLRYWARVDPRAVQDALRRIFAVWGLPQRLRVDNGTPWGTAGDLPPALALWLSGLGVAVIWNRPHHPQENARVERSHGVLKQWVEPERCANVADLRHRLVWAAQIQREGYPAIGGRSRMAAYPSLRRGGRAYDPQQE